MMVGNKAMGYCKCGELVNIPCDFCASFRSFKKDSCFGPMKTESERCMELANRVSEEFIKKEFEKEKLVPRAILSEKNDSIDFDIDVDNPRPGADRWERHHLSWKKRQEES